MGLASQTRMAARGMVTRTVEFPRADPYERCRVLCRFVFLLKYNSNDSMMNFMGT